MSDVNVRLNISAQGDAAQKLRSAADAASAADASMKALAASQQRVADTSARIGSGAMAARAAPSGGAGGGAAEQALTSAARDMAASTRQLAQTSRQGADQTRTQLQAQAQRSAEAGQAKAAQQGIEGGRGGRPGAAGAAQQGAEGGLLSGTLGKLLGGFLGVQGVQKILGGAAGYINARNDPTLDPSIRGQRAAESLPLVGGLIKTWQELKDAASGATKAMSQIALDFEELGASAKRNAEAIQASAALEARRAEPAARAEAFGRQGLFGMRLGAEAPVQLPQGMDRTTVKGEREYEQAVRRLPLETAGRGARLEETAARAELEAIKKQERGLREDYETAKARSAGSSQKVRDVDRADEMAKDQPGLPGLKSPLSEMGKAERDRVYNRAQLDAQVMLQAHQAVEQAVNRRGQVEVKVEQAASAARKANIGLMKEQLNVLNEEERRVSGAAQSWAGLSAAEKMATQNALERAKGQGLAALSGEERGLLGRAAPQFLQKEQEKVALADPAFKKFQEAIGEGADLQKIRKQQVEMTNKVQLDVAFDESQLAEAIAKKMGSVFDKLEKLIQDKIDAQTRDFLAGLKVRGVTK